MEPDEINEITNLRFINPKSREYLEGNNYHHWEDIYYFMKDNLDENTILLRNYKLKYLRIAYDLCDMNKISDLYEAISEEKYDNCWLKYAIQRSETELFERKISFSDQKLYIKLKNEEKPEYLCDKLNFFCVFIFII